MSVRSIAPAPEVAEREAVRTNAMMAALMNATPQQIDAWLTANVNNIADVRRVLAVLLRIAALYLSERR